jgi:hypothetical protein
LIRSSREPRGIAPPVARVLVRLSIILYCIIIFLALDFGYSALLHDEGHSARYPHPVYHHALLPNFDGYDNWGDHRYKFYTNSLGFRDASVRSVPASPASRRVLLIGDSFAEGTGVAFEDSFAGRLFAAGKQLPEPIEFLDAGVISYSPTLYLRKVRYLLDQGLRFDELIVFSDVSDVYDDATNYFCHDDDPRYQAHCPEEERAFYASLCGSAATAGCRPEQRLAHSRPPLEAFLTRHFVVTDRLRALAKFRIQHWLGNRKREMLAPTPESAWLFPGGGLERTYAPLGVDGGIARSTEKMRSLADLLRWRGIPLTIVVYPSPVQLARIEPENRQAALWRDFCAGRCTAFIDLTPAFVAAKQSRDDWYERLFIPGDFHYSPAGHEVMFRALSEHLLRPPAPTRRM